MIRLVFLEILRGATDLQTMRRLIDQAREGANR